MTDLQLEIARNQLVVKSNDLIQKTNYILTAQQQKIILYLISKIKPTDADFKVYSLDIHDLCGLCGIEFHGQNYKNLQDSLKKLHDSAFWLEIDHTRILVDWFTEIAIDTKRQKVTLRIDPRLKPYLLQLREQFTAYELGSVIQMKSKYSIRIYELLKSYSSLGVAQFEINTFRKMLDITDIYPEYKYFKRYVIDKSVQEINLYTDLNITFSTIKEGRSVTDLVFLISGKDAAEMELLRLRREIELKKGK